MPEMLGLFYAWDNPSVLQTTSPTQVNTLAACGQPLKLIKDWHVQTFRPKWFGLFGGPGQITYRTWSRKARQISVVDLDKRDIEIRMSIDGRNEGYTAVELDPSVDCGQDVKKCIDMGFASALILVPPGRHKVTAEIVKGGCYFYYDMLCLTTHARRWCIQLGRRAQEACYVECPRVLLG